MTGRSHGGSCLRGRGGRGRCGAAHSAIGVGMKSKTKKARVTTAIQARTRSNGGGTGGGWSRSACGRRTPARASHREEEPEPEEPRGPKERRAVVASKGGEEGERDRRHGPRPGRERLPRGAYALRPLRARRDRAEHHDDLEPNQPEDRVTDRVAQVMKPEPRAQVADDEACDADEEEREHRTMDEERDLVLPRAEERVRDVAAIELTDREQVDHRHEEPRPRAEADGRQPTRSCSRASRARRRDRAGA